MPAPASPYAACWDRLHAYQLDASAPELHRFSFALRQWRSVAIQGVAERRASATVALSQGKLLVAGEATSLGIVFSDQWARDDRPIAGEERAIAGLDLSGAVSMAHSRSALLFVVTHGSDAQVAVIDTTSFTCVTTRALPAGVDPLHIATSDDDAVLVLVAAGGASSSKTEPKEQKRASAARPKRRSSVSDSSRSSKSTDASEESDRAYSSDAADTASEPEDDGAHHQVVLFTLQLNASGMMDDDVAWVPVPFDAAGAQISPTARVYATPPSPSAAIAGSPSGSPAAVTPKKPSKGAPSRPGARGTSAAATTPKAAESASSTALVPVAQRSDAPPPSQVHLIFCEGTVGVEVLVTCKFVPAEDHAHRTQLEAASEVSNRLRFPVAFGSLVHAGRGEWLVSEAGGSNVWLGAGDAWQEFDEAANTAVVVPQGGDQGPTDANGRALVPVRWSTSAPHPEQSSTRLLLRVAPHDQRLTRSQVRTMLRGQMHSAAGTTSTPQPAQVRSTKAQVNIEGQHPHDSNVTIESAAAPVDAAIRADYATEDDETIIVVELVDVQRLVSVRLEQHISIAEERRRQLDEARSDLAAGWQQLREERARLGDLQRRLAQWDAQLDHRDDTLEASERDLNARIDTLNKDIGLVRAKNDQVNADREQLEREREEEREREIEADKRRRADRERQRQHERAMEAELKKQEKQTENLQRATDNAQMTQTKLDRELDRISREREQHKRDAQWARDKETDWGRERLGLDRKIKDLEEALATAQSTIDSLTESQKQQQQVESGLREDVAKSQRSVDYYEGRATGESDADWGRRKDSLAKTQEAALKGRWSNTALTIEAYGHRDVNCVSFALGSVKSVRLIPDGCSVILHGGETQVTGTNSIVSGTIEFEIGEGYVVGDMLSLTKVADSDLVIEGPKGEIGRVQRPAELADFLRVELTPGYDASQAIAEVFGQLAFRASHPGEYGGTRTIEFNITAASQRQQNIALSGQLYVVVMPPALEISREPAPFTERAPAIALFGHIRLKNPLSDLSTKSYAINSGTKFLAAGIKGPNRLIGGGDADAGSALLAPDASMTGSPLGGPAADAAGGALVTPSSQFRADLVQKYSSAVGRRCLTCAQPRLGHKVALSALLGTSGQSGTEATLQQMRQAEGMFADFDLTVTLHPVQPEDKLKIDTAEAEAAAGQVKVSIDTNGTNVHIKATSKLVTREAISSALNSVLFVSTAQPLDDTVRQIEYTAKIPHMPVALAWTAVRPVSIVNAAHLVEVSAANTSRTYRTNANTVSTVPFPSSTLWFASDVKVTDPFATRFRGSATFTLRHPTLRLHKDVLAIEPMPAFAADLVIETKEEPVEEDPIKKQWLQRTTGSGASPKTPAPPSVPPEEAEMMIVGTATFRGALVARFKLLEKSTQLDITFTSSTTADAATAVLRSVTFRTEDLTPSVRRTIACKAALGRGNENKLTFSVTSQLPIVAVERLGGVKWTEHQGPIPATANFGLNSAVSEAKAPPAPETLLHIYVSDGYEKGDLFRLDPQSGSVLFGGKGTKTGTGTPGVVPACAAIEASAVAEWTEYRDGLVTAYHLEDGSLVLRVANAPLKRGQVPSTEMLKNVTLLKGVLAAVTYEHTSSTPTLFKKVLSIRSQDFAGTYSDACIPLNVVPIDDPTEIHELPERTVFCQGTRETLEGYSLAPDALLVDPDTDDFIGGLLTLEPEAGSYVSSQDRVYMLSPEQQYERDHDAPIVFADERFRVFVFPSYSEYNTYTTTVQQEVLRGADQAGDDGVPPTLQHCVGALEMTDLSAEFSLSPLEDAPLSPASPKTRGSKAPATQPSAKPGPRPYRWHVQFSPPRQRVISLECVQRILRVFAFDNTSGRIATRTRRFTVTLGAGALGAAVNVEGARVADKTVMNFSVKILPAVFYNPAGAVDIIYQRNSGTQPVSKSAMVLPLTPHVRVHRATLTIELAQPIASREFVLGSLASESKKADSTDEESISLALRRDANLEIRGTHLVTVAAGAVGIIGALTHQSKSKIVIEFSPTCRIEPRQLQSLVRSINYNCSSPVGAKPDSAAVRTRTVNIALDVPIAMLDREALATDADDDDPHPALISPPLSAAANESKEHQPATTQSDEPAVDDPRPAAADDTADSPATADASPDTPPAANEVERRDESPKGEADSAAPNAEAEYQRPVVSKLFNKTWTFIFTVHVHVTNENLQQTALQQFRAEPPFELVMPERALEYTMRCGAFKIFNSISAAPRYPGLTFFGANATLPPLLNPPCTFTIAAPQGVNAPLLLTEDAIVTTTPLTEATRYALPRLHGGPAEALPVPQRRQSTVDLTKSSRSEAGFASSVITAQPQTSELRYNGYVVALVTPPSKQRNAILFEFLACPPDVVVELVRRVAFQGGGKKDRPGAKHTFKCTFSKGPDFADDITSLSVVVTPPYVDEISGSPLQFNGPAIAPFANIKVKAAVAFSGGRLAVDLVADSAHGHKISSREQLFLVDGDGFMPKFEGEDNVNGTIECAASPSRPGGTLGRFTLTAHSFMMRIGDDNLLSQGETIQAFVRSCIAVGQSPPAERGAPPPTDVNYDVFYSCTLSLEDSSQTGCEATVAVQGQQPKKKRPAKR